MADQQFDVFLCHNSEDKPAVIEIARQLQSKKIRPWLDKWELRPGSSWVDTLEAQIEQIQSVAVFVGEKGVGPWQQHEITAFLREFVSRGCPIIPVLLPDAQKEPRLPIFLRGNMWVDFRDQSSDPISLLLWGITKRKPNLVSSETMLLNQQFDVFLAHRSQNKAMIRTIHCELKARGFTTWLEEEEVAPGTTQFKAELLQVIDKVKTAAIFLGEGESGRWKASELKSFTDKCLERNIRAIPVLLPGLKAVPKDLCFLEKFEPVTFSEALADRNAFFRLEWGITGFKPPSIRDFLSPELQLLSSSGVDPLYGNLERYLENYQWKEADYETYRLMITIAGKKYRQWFDRDLRDFPVKPLKTIDDLWLKYSYGKFGFSVQKEIYLQCGGIPDGSYDAAVWDSFCHVTGWKQNNQYLEAKFETSAPRGHLPIGGGQRYWRRWWLVGDLYLFSLLSHSAL